MKSNYNEPHIEQLRQQPTKAVYVSIEGSRGPRVVVHDLGRRVWVWSNYAEQWPPCVIQVGDVVTNGYDQNGIRLMSVPEHMCHFIPTEIEALHSKQLTDISYRLVARRRDV